jgi:hypothetical protein
MTGRWKAWKTKIRFSTLPTALGNRSAIPTFPDEATNPSSDTNSMNSQEMAGKASQPGVYSHHRDEHFMNACLGNAEPVRRQPVIQFFAVVRNSALEHTIKIPDVSNVHVVRARLKRPLLKWRPHCFPALDPEADLEARSKLI